MKEDIKWELGQLRHLYKQMVDGLVTPYAVKSCAEGLLGPVIIRLEHYQKELDQKRSGVTPDSLVIE